MTNIELSKNINTKILTIRNTQVILDRDLAILYEVETRILNQAVKRNIKRFPKEFMFQLSKKELEFWMSQIVISKKETIIRANSCNPWTVRRLWMVAYS